MVTRTIATVIILDVCSLEVLKKSTEMVAAIAFSNVSTLEVTKQTPSISKK